MSKDVKHEILFQKCKESVEDVVGWKVFIFLPQNVVWRLLIVLTVILMYVLSTFNFLFRFEVAYYDFCELVCNVFYFTDTVCATMHYLMKNTRILRRGIKRREIFLLLDYLSLMPIHLIGSVLIFTSSTTVDEMFFYSRLNICLRIYQIQQFFSDSRFYVPTVKLYALLICLEVVVWYAIFMHFIACLFYLTLEENEKMYCHNNVMTCISHLEYFSFSLVSHTIKYNSIEIQVLNHWYFTCGALLFGHYLIYGFFFPMLLFAFFKYTSELVEISEKKVQMELLINNLTENRKLRRKIYRFFQGIWRYGDDKHPPDCLKLFPLCYLKNIYCDIHWEAFRHSKILCGLNLGCKRALSLTMSTEILHPNTTIIKKEEMKTFLIYVESGMLQAMAEENSNSPVLTLSGGTILGEFSLFYPNKSKVTLRSAKQSVIHYLGFRNFFLTMLNYPQEMAKLTRKMKHRAAIGKATYERKMRISLIFSEESASFALGKKKQANIKWIKQQYRSVQELDEALKKAKYIEDQKFYVNRKIQNLDTQLEHTSAYLNLLAVNDQVVNKYDLICLKTKFPWSLDPQSSFLVFWNYFILFIIFLTTWTYPIFTGWYTRLPLWFFNLTVLVNFIYFIDVLLLMMTAIRVKNVLIYNFWKVAAYRLMRPTFYCDIICSIPLQLMVYFYETRFAEYHIAIITDLTFLKCYRLLYFLHKWTYSTQSQITIRTLAKNTYYVLTVGFWLSVAFKLLEIDCIFYICSQEWISFYAEPGFENDQYFQLYASTFTIMFIGLDLPYEFFRTIYLHSFWVYFSMVVFFRFFVLLIHAECITSSVLQNIHMLNYKNIIDFMMRFVQRRRITGRISQRVLDTLSFQWEFDRGEYITQEKSIIEDLSPELLDEIIKDSVFYSLRMCPIFADEEEELLMDVIRESHHLALPANSLLVTFDTQTMSMFLIHKGFVQITSFLARDVVNNVGNDFTYGRGAIFPIVVALNQEPSVVTARTLTDCEMLVLHLEDILKSMIRYGMFKDIVDSLMATTDFKLLSSGKRGLSRINDVFQVNYSSYLAAFSKLKWFGIFLKIFLLRRAINSNSSWYVQWETVRVGLIFLDLFLWPFVFGCLCLSGAKIFLINILLFTDSLTWIDFYIRLHVAYFNSAGICVTHPSSTSLHYLTTSFLPDFISFLPYIHMLQMVYTGKYEYGFTIYISHMILKSFRWYRFFGLLQHLMDNKNFVFRIGFVSYIFTAILIYNSYINGRLLYALTIDDTFFLYQYRPLYPHVAYLVDATINLLTALRIWPYFEGFSGFGILHQVFVGGLGWLAEVFFFSYIILDAANANKSFMTYQYHLKTFQTYLNKEKVKETSIKKLMEHFEHEWDQKKGEDYKTILARFPDSLHEDLLYPLYKSTFNSVLCLADANEGFYRSLSRQVEEIVVKKGSIVIFNKEVQSYIFFLYKGQCLVQSSGLVLCKGSVIGNLRGQLLMTNTIIAKTHLVLLRIESEKFFFTLNNFHGTKNNYEYYTLASTDYIQSIYEDISAAVEEILIQKEDEHVAEAEFEIVDEDTYKATNVKGKMLKASHRKQSGGVFNPRSRASRIFSFIFLGDAVASVCLVFIMIGLRSVAIFTFLILYTFDAIWVLKIIVTLKTAYTDSKTGNLITNSKAIFLRYLNRYDGLVVDIISVIPFEAGPYIYGYITPGTNYCKIVFALCTGRLLRFLYFHRFANKIRKKLSSNFSLRWSVLLLSKIFLLNTCICLCLIANYLSFDYHNECYKTLHDDQLRFYLNTTACVINTYTGGGRPDCFPKYYIRLWEEIIIGLWAFVSRAKLMIEILHISHVIFFSKSEHVKELERLQNYLTARDISPALLIRVRNYYTDLTYHYKGNSMPHFLTNSAHPVKVNIMEGIYSNHLKNCYLFQELDISFVQQLSARMERNIFFPGDYIVEKTDVDNTMYFVHKGEVFCIEKNDRYPALEIPVYLFVKDDNFGLQQGIFQSYPHNYTYRAKTRAEVLLLNYNKWEDMRRAYPDIAAIIFDRALKKATDKPFRHNHKNVKEV